MAAPFRYLAMTLAALAVSAGTALAQPANDLFGLAQTLSGASGNATVSNIGASREVGEPCHAGNCGNRSIWFRFTATGSGAASFDTVGSNFDTTLGIYTGSAVTGLTEIASNDDIDYNAGNLQSRATFTATAGTTYFIAVDGYYYSDGTQSQGTAVLNFTGPGGGGGGNNNDFFGQAQVITGASGTVSDSNAGAGTEAGEANYGYASIWFQWTAPGTGVAQFNTTGSNFDTMLGGFSGATLSGLTTLAFNDDFNGTYQSQIAFNVTAGVTYYIVVTSYYSAEQGNVTLNWTAPGGGGGGNDFFATPTAISGATGTAQSSNTAATREGGEPCHAGNCGNRSIWFRWTAPAAGSTTFNTLNSNFDTTLGIYTGNAVGALTLVASNDDIDFNSLLSQATFTAAAGTTYYIAVDGFLYNDGTQSQGDVVLNWAPAVVGDNNDFFAQAQVITGATGTVSDSNAGAGTEAGEPNYGYASIWFRWTATGTGTAQFNTAGSNFDTMLGGFSGTALGGLNTLAFNDDFNQTFQSQISFNVVAGETYYIVVTSYYSNEQGNVTLNWAGPGGGGGGNDFFASPTALTGANGSFQSSNTAATREGGEPCHAGNCGNRSIWFRWTAPAGGATTFNTLGSNFDTTLGIYTGSAVGALTVVASNDDIDLNNLLSQATFTAIAGTTYYIAVDGYLYNDGTQSQGTVVINWAPGAVGNDNDFFGQAQLIKGSTGTVNDSNVTATTEAGEPGIGAASIWFRWTATGTGPARFTTTGSNFDTMLGAFSGTTISGLTQLAFNDDSNNTFQSDITFNVTAGATYYVAVTSYDTAQRGNVILNWTGPEGGGNNDFFATPTILTGASGTAQSSNTAATREAGEPCHTGNCGNRSIWFRWTAPGSGSTTFDTLGTSFDTVLGIYTGSAVNALTEIASNDDIDYNAGNLLSRATFTANAGTTYYIAVDGYLYTDGTQSQGSVVLNWTGSGAPVGNNLFANAQAISGGSGTIGGTVVGADLEAGEPQHAGNAGGHSVWYRWVPPAAGEFIFETAGSAFNTTLGIYTGGAVNALTQIAANNDIGGGTLQSRVTFLAVAGTTYYIAVDGADGATGNLTLSWRSANVIDLLPDLMAPADAGRAWIYGWRFDRTTQPGRTLMRITTGTPNVGTGPLELQGNSQTPDVVQRIYRSDGSTYTRPAGTFTFHPDHGHLHFDNFMQFRLRAVGPDNSVGAIIATGAKMSFAIIDLGVYDRTLPGSPASGRYSGGLLQGISVGYTDIYDQSISGQHIDITDIAPGRYWLEAEVDPENRVLEINEANNFGRIMVDLSPPTPPANDAFANAFASAISSQSWAGNTMGATSQAGEPSHAGWVGNSVWFRWTSPFTGTARVTTQGSDFDTVLAFYSGSAITSLTRLADSDDYQDRWSRVDVGVTVGTTYYIAVDGYSGAVGNYILNINPSGNDNFSNALTISGPSGTIGGSTLQATRQAGEPLHADISTLAGSIWYSWTPAASGEAVFTTVGSNFDTVLGVYTGTGVTALTRIAADDDAGGNFLSRVAFNATAGTRYYIAVDGYQTERGFVTLVWSAGAPCVAPEIVTGPQSRPAQLGNETMFSVVANGTGALTYQWFYSAQAGVLGAPIANGGRISGADTANLRITGIVLADAGFYNVRVSACDPALTTLAQAAQLVVTSDVGVHVEPTLGFVGQPICTAIELSASGGETFISGTVVFNANVFANPRIAAVPGIPAHTLNTSVSAGHIGFVLSLTGGASFVAGHQPILSLCLDAIAPAASSPIGFDSQLQAMTIMAGGVQRDSAVFAPSAITVVRPTRATGSFNAQGQYVLAITGEPGAQVQVNSGNALGAGMVGSTVTLDANGAATLTYPRATTGAMFYIVIGNTPLP